LAKRHVHVYLVYKDCLPELIDKETVLFYKFNWKNAVKSEAVYAINAVKCQRFWVWYIKLTYVRF